MGSAYTQTGVLAKGRAKEIKEPGRELGMVGKRPPPPNVEPTRCLSKSGLRY